MRIPSRSPSWVSERTLKSLRPTRRHGAHDAPCGDAAKLGAEEAPCGKSRLTLARKRLRAAESRPRERISACSGAEAFPCGGFRLILSKKWRAGAYVRQISLPKRHFQPHRDHCAPKPPFFLTQGQICIPDIKRANQTFIRGRRAKMQTSAKPVVKWWRAALDFVWPGSSRYRVTLCLVPFNGDQQRNSFHNLRTKSTMVASAAKWKSRSPIITTTSFRKIRSAAR